MLGCIPSPKFRVIHRSLLFEAIEKRKRDLLRDMLDALKAIEETDKEEGGAPSKDAVAEDEEEAREDKDKPTVQDEKTKEKKELSLLDQPNAEGKTLLHITTEMNDDEATTLLLNNGANPNVQDSVQDGGNSPLHTLCNQRDIKTATSVLRSNGKLLVNMASQL